MSEGTVSKSVAVSTSSVEALQERGGRRTAFVITPLTAGVTVYVAKGDVPAASNTGIVLTANQSYVESNSEGFQCWQGSVQILGSGAGTVAISETVQ